MKATMPQYNQIKSEKGFTLIELVVAIVIIGVALPSIFSLYASLSAKASDSAVMDQMVALAQNKMEEIIGKKEADWAWYKNPSQFAVNESLPDSYHRVVTVNTVNNWGNSMLDAWEIAVSVTNPRIDNNYVLTVRFTKYFTE